jgi:hypothetical protein
MCSVFAAQAGLDVAWSIVTCLFVLSKFQPSEVVTAVSRWAIGIFLH